MPPGSIFTGSNQLATLVQTIWSKTFFQTLRNNLVHIQSVNQDYQGDMRSFGDTVKINQFPDFSEADLLPQGGVMDVVDVTTTAQNLVANKRPALDVAIEDMAQLQSMPFMEQLQNSVTFAIMKRANREILNAMIPSASAPDHQISYTVVSTLGLADFLAAQELLNTQDVPMDNRFVVVGASGYSDMFNIGEFTSRDFNGGEATINNGVIGRPFVGFTPQFTNMVGATTQFYHRSCVAVAFQKQLNSKVADGGWVGARAQRLNTDLLMAVKQLDNKRLIRVD